MLESGLRIGEALHLEWQDITLAPYLGTSINHLHRDDCALKIEGKRKPIFPVILCSTLSNIRC
jgi:integrase